MNMTVVDFFYLSMFSWPDVVLRISLAVIFGAVIGWERDRKDKPIDSRVYMIVCVTTCIIAIMAQELLNDFPGAQDVVALDLGKVISGTLTGIGFLGAGSIIKTDSSQVIGTATGASIWASGGIGLTLGVGLYGLAFIGFVTIAGILIIGEFMFQKADNKK